MKSEQLLNFKMTIYKFTDELTMRIVYGLMNLLTYQTDNRDDNLKPNLHFL